MVEDAVSRCYQCQVATPEHKQEPVKPSEILETAWHTLSVDFGGPYPDGHYNLVVIDKRTKFPVVEQTTSTSNRVTCDRLRKIFATHGIPQGIESNNGPPFNSSDFREFTAEMGFQHHRITPEHPRANGDAESFMKVLNKTEQTAHSEGRSSNSAIQYMLMGYRSTPHPATGYSPYEALFKRDTRTKLDYRSLTKRNRLPENGKRNHPTWSGIQEEMGQLSQAPLMSEKQIPDSRQSAVETQEDKQMVHSTWERKLCDSWNKWFIDHGQTGKRWAHHNERCVKIQTTKGDWRRMLERTVIMGTWSEAARDKQRTGRRYTWGNGPKTWRREREDPEWRKPTTHGRTSRRTSTTPTPKKRITETN